MKDNLIYKYFIIVKMYFYFYKFVFNIFVYNYFFFFKYYENEVYWIIVFSNCFK